MWSLSLVLVTGTGRRAHPIHRTASLQRPSDRQWTSELGRRTAGLAGRVDKIKLPAAGHSLFMAQDVWTGSRQPRCSPAPLHLCGLHIHLHACERRCLCCWIEPSIFNRLLIFCIQNTHTLSPLLIGHGGDVDYAFGMMRGHTTHMFCLCCWTLKSDDIARSSSYEQTIVS